MINAPFNALLGRPLIGKGRNGAAGTGQAGGPGGLLWGDGGDGGSGAAGQTGAAGTALLTRNAGRGAGSPDSARATRAATTEQAQGLPGGFRVGPFVNNTGLSNSEIYLTLLGQTTPGQWSWIDQNGVAHHIDSSAANAPGHLTYNGVNYANMSFTLDQTGSLSIPSEFQGGRIFMSMKNPLYIGIAADNSGWAGLDPANPSDPNYNTVYDWYEMTYKNGAVAFGGNTTQVDQFGLPFSFTLGQTSTGFDGTRGITLSRDQVFQQYVASVPAEFQALVLNDGTGDPLRILAPRSATPGGLATWLDQPINDFWSNYQANQFNYDGPGYTVTGNVDGSGLFHYSVTPDGGTEPSRV
ncbi:beta-1,3-glucanase family protein [Mycobacterium gordonae]|uniref:beta-1,3-glucanase family protein n=1 Tax=Mycobacterium gordonae TaxID=1778 RepID=UPI003F5112A8